MKPIFFKKLIKEEKASASIVEYSIVLPICLFVILFIFMLGYMLNQRAVLDAAAYRAIIIAQKMYADPKYNEIVITELNEDINDYVGYKTRRSFDIKFNNDPYRYLGFGENDTEKRIKKMMKEKITHIIMQNQLFQLSDRLTNLEIGDIEFVGFINKKVSVTVTQEFNFPLSLGMFGIEPIYKMTSKASFTLTNPTELIRNTDFVLDTVEKYTDVDITTRLKGFFSKISDFFKTNK